MVEQDEPGLVSLVQRGDTSAFGTLVERYSGKAYGVALSIVGTPQDAEDAVQTAFVRALGRIGQLRPGSPFGPWFFSVLRSTALNLRRREGLRSHPAIPDTTAGEDQPDRELDRTLTRERVLEALETLPEQQRTAVVLYDLQGFSHKEIAESLGVAAGTSRAHVHHGRRALRDILGPVIELTEGES